MHAVTTGFDMLPEYRIIPIRSVSRKNRFCASFITCFLSMDEYKKVVSSKLKFKGSVLPVKEKKSK